MPRGVSSSLDYVHVALLYHIGTGALYHSVYTFYVVPRATHVTSYISELNNHNSS